MTHRITKRGQHSLQNLIEVNFPSENSIIKKLVLNFALNASKKLLFVCTSRRLKTLFRKNTSGKFETKIKLSCLKNKCFAILTFNKLSDVDHLKNQKKKFLEINKNIFITKD
jgi:hypothetical protein